MLNALKRALEEETSLTGKEVLKQLVENAAIASAESVPICQDTGVAVVFVELGQDVHITGGDFYAAINKGVAKGYQEGFLRASIYEDLYRRKNTGDNTPAVIHCQIVPGDKLKITVAPKGGGSENMSAIKMLRPADRRAGAKKFIVDQVFTAGSNPCPPIIVGVGMGGTFEKVALLAKEALLRPLGQKNSLPEIAQLEEELLLEINKLGIGPGGLGGKITALAVHVEMYPVHGAMFPVAVNISCHANRHKSIVL